MNPIPSPETIRPAIMGPVEETPAWIPAPASMKMEPIPIHFLRPSLSPMMAVAMAPTQHPISYCKEMDDGLVCEPRSESRWYAGPLTMATIVPRSVGLGPFSKNESWNC